MDRRKTISARPVGPVEGLRQLARRNSIASFGKPTTNPNLIPKINGRRSGHLPNAGR